MKSIPISLQLWSVRDALNENFSETLKRVSDIGYTGVEMAGYAGLTPADAANAVAEAGLLCSGMHVPIQRLRSEPEAVAEEAKLFGTKNVVCPYYPREELTDEQAFIKLAAELDSIGKTLSALGCQLHYHNHDFELLELGEKRGMEILLENASAQNLSSQADLYWIHKGGLDPSAYLESQDNRVSLVHVKDETELGSGPIDYPNVFQTIEKIGAVEWYIVEVERYSMSPIDSVAVSFEQMRKWGKVAAAQ